MENNSLFIAIEGLDGSGKSTITKHLTFFLENVLKQSVKLTYEPNDPSCGGDYIRLVLAKKIPNYTLRTLMLAFAANRLDHCNRVINPWLDQDGKAPILICDRYYLSSLVYQSDHEISFDEVMEVNHAARIPDLTIFMNVSNEVCLQRMNTRNKPLELFERNLSDTRSKYLAAIQYLREVRNENILMVNADGTIKEVLTDVVRAIATVCSSGLQSSLARIDDYRIEALPDPLSPQTGVAGMPIDHIGIAVQSLKDSLAMYERLFSVKPYHSEMIADQKVRVCFIQMGDQKLELLEATSEESPIHKFIQKKGEGMHHIAYRVDNIRQALVDVANRGFRLIDQEPRRGALNKWIAFIHPKDTDGVLIELCQTINQDE